MKSAKFNHRKFRSSRVESNKILYKFTPIPGIQFGIHANAGENLPNFIFQAVPKLLGENFL
jgi:hypothetical protein